MALDLLVEKVKHGVATLAVLSGVALEIEPLWVASASLFNEVVGTSHCIMLGIDDMKGLPLFPLHDITCDAFRLTRWLITPVGF